MRQNARRMAGEGWDCYCFWGRGKGSISDHEVNFASPVAVYLHAALARLTDRPGFYSRRDTERLVDRLDEIGPDVVHVHGMQGYYINMPVLFEWLSRFDGQIWFTLHDCWAFTGHCPYFTAAGCDRWLTGCGGCPQTREYPKSILLDQSARNYRDKKRLFSLLDPTKVTLVCPSRWLEGLVKRSFLSGFRTVVRHNEVDKTVFRPTPGSFRARHDIGDRFMVLGVASPWTERKGFNVFLEIAEKLGPGFALVLVGLSKDQIKEASRRGIVGLPRTDSPKELAEIYSAADVLLNPTREDNFPTVLLEAQGCGTSVITYDTGGCRETYQGSGCFICIPQDVRCALDALIHMKNRQDEENSSFDLSKSLPY